jgi:hypothetical protein
MAALKVWTKRSTIAALKAESRRLGRPLGILDLRASGRVCPSDRTVIRLFGSVTTAFALAGIPRKPHGRPKGYRFTHCKRGHERTPDNLDTRGHCIECSQGWKSRIRRKSERPAPPEIVPLPASVAARLTQRKQAWWANGCTDWRHPYARSAS